MSPGFEPFPTIAGLAPALEKRQLSPVEVAEYYLDRIGRCNEKLDAYLCVTADRALAAARAAETAIRGGHYIGPLHGIPLAVKDLVDVSGLPTTGGSLLFRDKVAARDATCARRLWEAGAVLLGKTGLVEFAFGGTGVNHHYGTPWNPWDAGVHRLPGGSSSGSGVAVAADLAAAAIGSDTGGSVRIPASFCGIVGLKPTFGRLSNSGVLPLDSALDSVGPMARCVRDAALLYRVLAGPDPADPDTWDQPVDAVFDELEGDVGGMRVCLPREYFWEEVDPEVEAAVRACVQVLADQGVDVDEVSVEELEELAELQPWRMTSVETYLRLREYIEEDPGAFDPVVAGRILAGKEMTACEYVHMQRRRQELRRSALRRLDGIDALLAPTTAIPAPTLEETDTDENYGPVNLMALRNTLPVNQLGLCAVSLPCGLTRGGLPVGLQLIGKPYGEGRLLRLARAFEDATEWHLLHPEVDLFD